MFDRIGRLIALGDYVVYSVTTANKSGLRLARVVMDDGESVGVQLVKPDPLWKPHIKMHRLRLPVTVLKLDRMPET